MQAKQITVKNKTYHFLEAGSGKKILLCLHGYGNDAYLFQPFVAYLKDAYIILSFYLPHHGSENSDYGTLTKSDLHSLVKRLLEEYHVEKINLLGYSIGGRLCLCMIETAANLVEKCVLVAPDGLAFNWLYYFATKNRAGRWLFRRLLSDEKYLHVFHRVYKNHIIPEKKYRFVMHYLHTENDRKKLLHVWNDLAPLVPNGEKLRLVIPKNKVALTIFMGEKDSVIPVKKALQFVKKVPVAHLRILHKGHRMLDAATISLIAKTLQSS